MPTRDPRNRVQHHSRRHRQLHHQPRQPEESAHRTSNRRRQRMRLATRSRPRPRRYPSPAPHANTVPAPYVHRRSQSSHESRSADSFRQLLDWHARSSPPPSWQTSCPPAAQPQSAAPIHLPPSSRPSFVRINAMRTILPSPATILVSPNDTRLATTFTPATAPVRVRIAPSPTGDPHVGTAYIGLLNLHLRQTARRPVRPAH